MNRIVKPIFGVVAVVAIGIVGYLGTKAEQTDICLSSLVQTADADAECGDFRVTPGRCLTLSGVCVYDTTLKDCSP